MSQGVFTGLDRLARGDAQALLRGKKLGLLAHPASVDRRLRHVRAVLEFAGLDVRACFGPEHGYGGEAQDMIAVGDETRSQALPIYSLYASKEASLSPQEAWLEGLDAVVIDLQDVGSRYYTYIWTAALMLRACAPLGIEVVVLDRPNPLGGEILEGRAQRPGHRSFVGLYDVPVRHGLSIGEVLRMVCEIEGIDPRLLHVVEMEGYRASMRFPETGLPWVLPSPNMPTVETATVYPGGCLIEGTELSEGRGQTRPFEVWGAPGLEGAHLANDLEIPGALLRPLRFIPTFHKHAGELCGGVQVHVTDVGRFRSYSAYQRLLARSRELLGEGFSWRRKAYEFVEDIPAIDLLTGGPEFREHVDAGRDIGELLEADRQGAEAFREAREPWLLYPRSSRVAL